MIRGSEDDFCALLRFLTHLILVHHDFQLVAIFYRLIWIDYHLHHLIKISN